MDAQLLYTPSKEKIQSSNFIKYFQFLKNKYNLEFDNYEELHKWSVENLEDSWSSIFEFVKIKTSAKYINVLEKNENFYESKWFTGCKLNFAENLLRYQDEQIAIVSIDENNRRQILSYKELYQQVAHLVSILRSWGVNKGDRVVAYTPNISQTIIMMLATTSIGAVFSSTSIDFGVKGVIDRFGQIKPKVLLTVDGYTYKGKKISSLENVQNILSQLDSIEKIIIVPFLENKENVFDKILRIKNAFIWDDVFLEEKTSVKSSQIEFEQISFQDPVDIMYTSGTTGLPKCIVQGSGVLVNHLKELILHSDLKREDIIFYFTTTGWMMWNWLVSSLAVGATIVLYEGNPAYPKIDRLWQMAEEEKISIFGTGAKYIDSLMNQKIEISKKYNLSSLKTILSTGSPLSSANYEYVYTSIKKDLQLSSIAGGTDLNGCFVLGNPFLPVYEGEIQCIGLGMDVAIYDEDGSSVTETKGELVCRQPFPSMPLFFWEDENNVKYKNSYFSTYRNIWRHGDFAKITSRNTIIIYGRSDATLNPGGVRIGTSDIYELVEKISGVEDSLVIGKTMNDDVKILLFIKVQKDNEISLQQKEKSNVTISLTDDKKEIHSNSIVEIKKLIKEKLSPRHVPYKIFLVQDIPYTLNMKKVELVIKKIFNKESVTNKDALKNPECLEEYKQLAKSL